MPRKAKAPSSTPEYSSYKHARGRCNNPNDKKYPDYGERGIKFLFTDFEHFRKHIGRRPKGTTLDRIDNDGHYAPGNVRWATVSVQNANRRPWRRKAHA